MTSAVRLITFDCHDPTPLARFWATVTGYTENAADPNLPGDDEAYLGPPEHGPALLFIRVPEGKTVKNRLHLDVQPVDRTRDEEVDRLIAAGATRLADHRNADGSGWVTLADPEGNEFCVERSAAERTQQAAAPTS
ncbi:MAG TPA: VOC family protein [Candidatus Nanopelagicales bacterium]|jgi:hypothetical protein|nr:VOC family protein [Candidatus Nanopelagicales bacterium]